MSRPEDHDRDGGDLPRVLLLEDMARLLRCSTATIKRRVRAGVFPVPLLSGVDKKYRWSREPVLSWLATGQAPGGVGRKRRARDR